MRNLKRVLSLALASAMLLGMMVMGAGAADTKKTLSDLDKVTNKEAVNLMVDLGIITGKPDGSYAPTETVDRATMATLIYKIMMGTSDASGFVGTSTSLTDVKGTWAEGFINYCYSVGIVAGTGNNTYDPTGKVAVVSAAKMLLVAIGYDAEGSKYQNDSMWSVNIMRDAQKAGLLKGIDQKSTDELTRDNAAQMIFNALFAENVLPDFQYDMGVKYLKKYDPQGTYLSVTNYKLYAVTAPVIGIDSKGMATLGAAACTGFTTVAGSTLTNVLPGTPDMVGSSVTVYVKGTDSTSGLTRTLTVDKIYSTIPAVSATNVLATNYGYKVDSSAAEVTGTAAMTALLFTDKTKIATAETGKTVANLTYYYNGASDAAKVSEVGKYGVVTEFKDTNNISGVDTVVITAKTVATLTADPVIATSGDKTTVTISNLGLAKVDATKVIGYEGLKKDDVVLYVKMGGMTYIEKAESVKGVPSGNHNTKGMLLDSAYYLNSTLLGTTAGTDWTNDYTNTYTFFLDNGKHVVKAVKETDAKVGSYAVLTDIALVTTSGVNGTHYVEGKLLLTDGTTEVVKIASINGASVVLTGASLKGTLYHTADGSTTVTTTAPATVAALNQTFFYSAITATSSTAKYFGATATADLTDPDSKTITSTGTYGTAAYATKGSFYEYTVNSDGNYVLTSNYSNKATAGALTNNIIDSGKATFNTGNVGNSATLFLYATTDTAGKTTYTVYNGIANAPTTALAVTNHSVIGAIVKNSAGVATHVYVETSGTVSASSDKVYFSDVTKYTSGSDGGTAFRIYDAVVNGENKTIKVDSSTYPATAGLYVISNISSKDISTLTSTTATVATATGIKSAVDGTFILTGDAYTYNDDTVAYYIDGDGVSTSIAVSALSVNVYDDIYVFPTVSGGKIADTIYVIHNDPALAVLTMTAQAPLTLVDGTLEDGSGSVTGWTANTNTITITTVTGAANTTVGAITINDAAYMLNSTYAVGAVGTLTIKVMVTDNYSNAIDVITATVTVA